MSFEGVLPKHLLELKNKRSAVRQDMRQLTHDCDCEFCDVGFDVLEANQEAYDKKKAELAGVEKEIRRLKAHAKLHHIKLEDS